MSTSESSVGTSGVAEQGTAESAGLFTAFREQRTFDRRWLYAALVPLVPLLAVIATFISMRGQQNSTWIVTPHGIRRVNPGMSRQEVTQLLGHPIGQEQRADGAECFMHGMFSMAEPETTVYVLCYLDGLLKDVTTRRYSLWAADPNGQFAPAGLDMGDGKAPAKAPAKP